MARVFVAVTRNTRSATAPEIHSPSSVVIIFKLVSNSSDHNVFAVDDLEKCYISRAAKWNDQLTHEGALTRFAASERRRAQARNAIFYRLQRPLGQLKIAVVTLEFAFQHEIEQLLQILGRLQRQSNAKVHRLLWALLALAKASLRSRFPITTSAST